MLRWFWRKKWFLGAGILDWYAEHQKTFFPPKTVNNERFSKKAEQLRFLFISPNQFSKSICKILLYFFDSVAEIKYFSNAATSLCLKALISAPDNLAPSIIQA